MTSTKKDQKIKCRKCEISLSSINWHNYDQKKKYYICKLCRKEYDRVSHQNDENYAKKQNGRYRMRRSAVILAYGNTCITCGEDDYSKLKINGDVNFLYNNIVQSTGYNVSCFNCSKSPYKNKYTLKHKMDAIYEYGTYCCICLEDHIEKLTLLNDTVFCYNCKMNKLYNEKYVEEDDC